MMKMKEGKIYKISHSRKGTFVAKITAAGKEWTQAIVIEGETLAMNPENIKVEGDPITFRTSFISDVQPWLQEA